MAPDAPQNLQRYFMQNQFNFWTVADVKGRLLQTLGQEINWLRFGRMPALLGVNKEGKIVWQHFGRSARDIPDFNQAIGALREPRTHADD